MTRVVAIGALFTAVHVFAQTRSQQEATARAQYDRGDFAGCLKSYEALSNGPEWSKPADALYSAACCAALGGQPDVAFGLLDRLAQKSDLRGFADTLTDDDLKSLRADKRWKKHVAAVAAHEKKNAIAPEMKQLIDADQADRSGAVLPADAVKRDAERRVAFEKIFKAGKLKTAHDYWAAALLFQHGNEVADIARAMEFAKKANSIKSTCSTRRMMALTEDRWLMYQHKPQKYGTQFVNKVADGGPPVWTLYDVDPAVIDAERDALCVGPIAEAQMP